MCPLAFFGVLELATYGFQNVPMHGERRQPEPFQFVGFGEAGDVQEYLVDVGADLGVAGEQSEIGVLPRRARMVVAGPQVCIRLQLRFP
jgi:hypothetical protein